MLCESLRACGPGFAYFFPNVANWCIKRSQICLRSSYTFMSSWRPCPNMNRMAHCKILCCWHKLWDRCACVFACLRSWWVKGLKCLMWALLMYAFELFNSGLSWSLIWGPWREVAYSRYAFLEELRSYIPFAGDMVRLFLSSPTTSIHKDIILQYNIIIVFATKASFLSFSLPLWQKKVKKRIVSMPLEPPQILQQSLSINSMTFCFYGLLST